MKTFHIIYLTIISILLIELGWIQYELIETNRLLVTSNAQAEVARQLFNNVKHGKIF